MIIAVDGESASGKGTVSKILANKLSLKYLETGLLYRGLAYVTGNNLDEKFILESAQNLDLDKIPVHLLKTDKIAQKASQLAKIFEVRQVLNIYQRKFIEKYKDKGVILDGRDIGTVICPHADFKFYMSASLQVRAKRRYQELKQQHPNISVEYIENSLSERDIKDKTREVSALKKADDAIEIDTSNLTINEVIDKIIVHIKTTKH